MTLSRQAMEAEDNHPELLVPFFGFALVIFFVYCYPIARVTRCGLNADTRSNSESTSMTDDRLDPRPTDRLDQGRAQVFSATSRCSRAFRSTS